MDLGQNLIFKTLMSAHKINTFFFKKNFIDFR